MEKEQNQNTKQVPPQPVVKPKKSNFLSSKWLKIGAVLVVLLLIAGGTYLLGQKNSNKLNVPPPNEPSYKGHATPASTVAQNVIPTPNSNIDTSSWKTYTNNNSKISFKYPAGWSLKQESPNIIFTKSAPGKNETGGITVYSADLNINTYQIAKTDTLEDLYEKYYPVEKGQDLNSMLKEWTTKWNLDKQNALYFIEPGCCQNNGNGIISIYNNTGYVIRLSGRGEDLDLNGQEALDGVISTFKFTDSSNSTTANPGEHCGGNISTAQECSTGYHCQLEKVADLGGTCVKD